MQTLRLDLPFIHNVVIPLLAFMFFFSLPFIIVGFAQIVLSKGYSATLSFFGLFPLLGTMMCLTLPTRVERNDNHTPETLNANPVNSTS